METNSSAKLDKKNQKKKFIADIAFDLFLKNGYTNTKVIDIAMAAGIGKGTMYEYFPSKEALLLFLIDTKVLTEYSKISDYVSFGSDVFDKLQRYFDFEAEFVLRFGVHCNDIRMQFFEANTDVSEGIFHAISKLIRINHETVYKIVAEGIESGKFRDLDPALVTDCICGMTNALLSHSECCPHFDSQTPRPRQKSHSYNALFGIITQGIAIEGN